MSNHSFDSAALAGATLAATLAVLGEPGPFDWMNGVVGLTLLTIVLAYEGQSSRNLLQSVALSMVMALSALLPVCVGLEWYYGHRDLEGKMEAAIVIQNRLVKEAEIDTAIPDPYIPYAWLGLFVAAFVVEFTLLQRIVKAQQRARQGADGRSNSEIAPNPRAAPGG